MTASLHWILFFMMLASLKSRRKEGTKVGK
jgi:hypothetical protein